MGLDQYIERRKTEERPPEIDPDDWSDWEQVAYFRKVNFLHEWVEQNLNKGESTNCDYIDFSLEAMAGLVATCHRVLESPTKGQEILPTASGFFFGSTEYDDYYLDDVRSVAEALEAILKTEAEADPPGSGRYAYFSWW